MEKPRYKYRVQGNYAFVRQMGSADGEADGRVLRISLVRGSMEYVEQTSGESEDTAFGVIGAGSVGSEWVVAFITGVAKVATVEGCPIYRVTATKVVGWVFDGKKSNTTQQRYMDLMKEALDPEGAGRGLYFSPGMDLTVRLQKQAASGDGQSSSDKMFLWNGAMAAPFHEAGASGLVAKMIMGSVQQVTDMDWCGGGRHVVGQVTLISRRSVKRAGTRHWRRGADAEGWVANFVESEQIMEFWMAPEGERKTEAPVVASFVQVRGSVPVLWMQPPNLFFQPPSTIGPSKGGKEALRRHFKRLKEVYGQVTALSLLSDHGREGKLQRAYHEGLYSLENSSEEVPLIHFDVHKECGAVLNLGFAEKLQPKTLSHLDKLNIFYKDNEGVHSVQDGVIRTNCFDSLDRTNMAQATMGAWALEVVLRKLGLMLHRPGIKLALIYPTEEAALRVMWADNGDQLAREYAGSGAMKSDYTRTGRVSALGFADDIGKVTLRYFLNTFADGRKQDAIDLLLGEFRGFSTSQALESPERLQSSLPLPALLSAAALLMLWMLSRSWWSSSFVVLAFTLALLCGMAHLRVNHPTLCATVHKPW